MEANVQLTRVIQEMRAEISKLEKENQALRMKLTSSSQRSPGSGAQSGHDLGNPRKVPGQSPATSHGAASTDSAPDVRGHQGNVMIVRRYSISTPIHSFATDDPWKAGERHPNHRILEAQGAVKSLACSPVNKQDNEEKMLTEESHASKSSSHRALPEHVLACRDKIKTVSFLLPMDIASYSKNSSSLKYSSNQTTKQLSTIAE